MSKARLVITAVVVEGRPVAQVAADYKVSRQWIYKLLARYRSDGIRAFEPRSGVRAQVQASLCQPLSVAQRHG